ncbi:unnamed protein product, partial [Urochloa humidicola]
CCLYAHECLKSQKYLIIFSYSRSVGFYPLCYAAIEMVVLGTHPGAIVD